MKRLAIFLLAFSGFVSANPLLEKASYLLDDDSERTSWLIKEGQLEIKVKEAVDDEKLGAAYVVTIDYSLEARLFGDHKGSIGLLVPATMFEDQFFENIRTNHPVDLGAFHVDYEGMYSAEDSDDNLYDECTMIRIYDLDPSYRPVPTTRGVSVLWHESSSSPFSDVEMTLKTHRLVPVLRAVQIDISGTVKGIDLKAGFDYVPAHSVDE